MSNAEDFSHRLSKLRDNLGMSQDSFAKILGVSRNYVSMLENGKEPSRALANLFDRLEAEHANAPGELPQALGPRGMLKILREKRGLSQLQLARAVGYSLGVYQGIEEGRSGLSRKMAEKLAIKLEVDAATLLDGGDEPPANGPTFGTFGETPDIKLPPGMRAKFVPLLSMAQCGTMAAYDDTAYSHDGYVAFDSEDPKAFAVTLAGDSMTPVCNPGDVALIYPSDTPRNGDIVIVRLNDTNGDVMVKLYQASGSSVTLSSYNPAYPPMSYPRSAFAWIYPVAKVTKSLRQPRV